MAPSRGSAAASGGLSRVSVAVAVPLLLFLSASLLPGAGSETSESPGATSAQGVVGRDELQHFLLWLRRNAVFGIGDTVRYSCLCSPGIHFQSQTAEAPLPQPEPSQFCRCLCRRVAAPGP